MLSGSLTTQLTILPDFRVWLPVNVSARFEMLAQLSVVSRALKIAQVTGRRK